MSSLETTTPGPDAGATTERVTASASSDTRNIFEVGPHLTQYNIPLKDFFLAKPGFTHFVSGAWIFTTKALPGRSNTKQGEDGPIDATDNQPRVLLLRRSQSDSYPGFWEGPGGLVEPERDATLLQGVAREVLEETGLRVTRFVDLVRVDEWAREKCGEVRVVAKFSFLVDVASPTATSTATAGAGADDGQGAAAGQAAWEEMVKLDPTEHQEYRWVTEGEVRDSVEFGRGQYRFVGRQGQNCLRAFEMFKALRRPLDSSCITCTDII